MKLQSVRFWFIGMSCNGFDIGRVVKIAESYPESSIVSIENAVSVFTFDF